MIHWHWVGYHRFYSTKSKLPYLLISCFSFRTLIAGNAGVLCPGLHFPWQRMELQGQMVGPRTRKLRERCLKCSEMYGSNVTLQAQEQIPLHQNPTLGIHIHTQLVYFGLECTLTRYEWYQWPFKYDSPSNSNTWYAMQYDLICRSLLFKAPDMAANVVLIFAGTRIRGSLDTRLSPIQNTFARICCSSFFQQFVPSLSTFCWIHCASFNHVFGKTLAFILRNEVEQTYSTGEYCVVLPHYPHSCQKSSWI